MLNSEMNKIRRDRVLNQAKEAYDEITEIEERVYQQAFTKMKLKAEEGWTWFQDKRVDENKREYTYYGWLIYDKNGKPQPSNVNNSESIMKSGLWERLDNGVKDGYYQWVKTN